MLERLLALKEGRKKDLVEAGRDSLTKANSTNRGSKNRDENKSRAALLFRCFTKRLASSGRLSA